MPVRDHPGRLRSFPIDSFSARTIIDQCPPCPSIGLQNSLSMRAGLTGNFLPPFRPADEAAKTNVTGRGIDRLALARRRPVAQAIIGRAEVRAAFHHPASE